MHLRPPASPFHPNTSIITANNDNGVVGEAQPGVEGEAEGEPKSKEERDKERWARLKRLKQVFRVRRKVPKEGVPGKEGDKK